jgi:hypothetical protein
MAQWPSERGDLGRLGGNCKRERQYKTEVVTKTIRKILEMRRRE